MFKVENVLLHNYLIMKNELLQIYKTVLIILQVKK